MDQHKNSFKRILFPITCLFVILFVYGTVFIPRVLVESKSPGVTQYGFPIRFLNDYFQYVAIIKNGQQGLPLGYNPYTEEIPPAPLPHPFYHILGVISGPFHISPFIVYDLTYLLCLGIFLLFTAFLIQKSIESEFYQSVAYLLFATATNFWWTEKVSGAVNFVDPETYSHWFNLYLKFTMNPAHHYLSIALFGFLLFLNRKLLANPKVLLLTFLLSILLALIHPYNAAIGFGILFLHAGVSFLFSKKRKISVFFPALVSACTVAPFIAYHRYILLTQFHGVTTQANTIAWGPPLIPLQNYLLALGPLLISAIVSLSFRDTWKNPLKRLFVYWAFVPTILFYIPNIGIPTGGLRLFEVYQHIPLAILATFGISGVIKKIIRPIPLQTMFVIVVTSVFVLYTIPQYVFNVQANMQRNTNYFHLMYMLSLAKPALNYLNDNTEKKSVVMSAESFGMFIPAFTNNITIIGQDGNNTNYAKKRADILNFFYGMQAIDTVPSFLHTYRARYLIFGFDSPDFEQTPYKGLPYLKVVYAEGGITIVKVTLPE